MRFRTFTAALAGLSSLCEAKIPTTNPYDEVAKERVDQKDPLVVDLGYAIYNGYTDANTSLNVWKGSVTFLWNSNHCALANKSLSRLHYATPPLKSLRFKAPEVPEVNRGAVQHAWTDPPACVQSSRNISMTGNMQMDENCLFLNVFASSNTTDLPVFVWIHGGGYAGGSASTFDPSSLMKTGKNGFVAVVIQYRLGPFGFLSSEEVRDQGGLNAGIQDIQLTLQWVQKYIGMFGGDPKRVTIAGESAGAGAVMILATAYGGSLGPTLFESVRQRTTSVVPMLTRLRRLLQVLFSRRHFTSMKKSCSSSTGRSQKPPDAPVWTH